MNSHDFLQGDARWKLINCPNEHYGVSLIDADFAAGVDSGNAAIFATVSPLTVTLPDSTANPGLVFFIKKVDPGGGTITIAAAGSDLIDGAAVETLTVQYEGVAIVSDGNGNWDIISEVVGGSSAVSSGRLLATHYLTTGTSFTTGAATNSIFLRMVGGGGGGGGFGATNTTGAAGGGGGSGSYAEKTFAVTPSTPYVYAIGALGAGGATATPDTGAAGSMGGATTFTVGATTVTAHGGGGGQCTPTTTLGTSTGGAAGTVSLNGDLNSGGAPGEPGIVLGITTTTTLIISGGGGSSVFGGAFEGRPGNGGGANAVGYGSGGSGSASLTGLLAEAGGNGSAGLIVVEEYS